MSTTSATHTQAPTTDQARSRPTTPAANWSRSGSSPTDPTTATLRRGLLHQHHPDLLMDRRVGHGRRAPSAARAMTTPDASASGTCPAHPARSTSDADIRRCQGGRPPDPRGSPRAAIQTGALLHRKLLAQVVHPHHVRRPFWRGPSDYYGNVAIYYVTGPYVDAVWTDNCAIHWVNDQGYFHSGHPQRCTTIRVAAPGDAGPTPDGDQFQTAGRLRLAPAGGPPPAQVRR